MSPWQRAAGCSCRHPNLHWHLTAFQIRELPASGTSWSAYGAGCSALATPDLATFVPTVGTTANWSLGIPNPPSLAGLQIYNRALELGALFSLSNGGVGQIQ